MSHRKEFTMRPDKEKIAQIAHRLASEHDLSCTIGVSWDALIPEHREAWVDFATKLAASEAFALTKFSVTQEFPASKSDPSGITSKRLVISVDLAVGSDSTVVATYQGKELLHVNTKFTPEQQRVIDSLPIATIVEYVRCPLCHLSAKDGDPDICVPWKQLNPQTVICEKCGSVRLPYDCTSEHFLVTAAPPLPFKVFAEHFLGFLRRDDVHIGPWVIIGKDGVEIPAAEWEKQTGINWDAQLAVLRAADPDVRRN